MVHVLVVCVSTMFNACGYLDRQEFPNLMTCERSANMILSSNRNGNNGVVAYCVPKQ